MTPVAAGRGTHRGLVYDSPARYERAVTSFVRDGLDRDERVLLMATPRKLDHLRQALDEDAGEVEFADTDQVYRRQGQAIRAVLDYLATTGDRHVRLVAEQSLSRRSPSELAYYLRLEAAANVIFDRFPISILCPYDATVLSNAALTGCEEAHPELLADAEVRPSERFVDPAAYIAGKATVVAPPPSAIAFPCERVEDLGPARAFLRAQAAAAGLDRRAVSEFVLGGDELVSNALVHGAAPRHLWVYIEAQSLVCHVHDSGPGFADPLAVYLPPDQRNGGGRGLWIAHQASDAIEVGKDGSGTHVRLLASLADRSAVA